MRRLRRRYGRAVQPGRSILVEDAARANKDAGGRAPVILTADSSRQDLIRWLKWNDPNGVYTDADRAAEDLSPLSLHDAWWHIGSL